MLQLPLEVTAVFTANAEELTAAVSYVVVNPPTSPIAPLAPIIPVAPLAPTKPCLPIP